MDIRSKDDIRVIIVKDFLNIHNRRIELSKRLSNSLKDNLDYFEALFTQLSQPTCGPLIAKTPKILRKKGIQRIETIPENDVLHQEDTSSCGSVHSIKQEEIEIIETVGSKLKRVASKKASDNIKEQHSLTFHTKLRRPSNDENDNVFANKDRKQSQVKRKKSRTGSSDEEDNGRGSKYSKLDEHLSDKDSTKKVTSKKSAQSIGETFEKIEEKDTSRKSGYSSRSRSKKSQNIEINKSMTKIDDMIIAPARDDIDEPSMYEDAIGKPTPIMNSTLKYSSILPEKILNATVVLETLPKYKLNETIVIRKASTQRNSRESMENNFKKALQDSSQPYEKAIQDKEFNGLITDDESSPELKKSKKQISKKNGTKKTKRARLTSSDDEVPNTPVKTHFKDVNAVAVTQESKSTYKLNALFSPYAKESVKKRVEAFEQAVMHSPKSVNADAPRRVTRTKTRAMAAAEAEAEIKNVDKTVAQVLARKSLAKAKKISLAKQKKTHEESKENKEQMPERINKLLLSEKQNTKHIQQIKTPLTKTKIQPPSSINRFLQTPSNTQSLLHYQKALTASRTNIVTTMDSFIQIPKTASKTHSAEKLEDKRRHEEDARKKREETLRLQTEERRRKRQEKELKNKLAREAKEKQNLEKRHKAEKEKEEKAKLAQMMQEKVREEMEKKRLAQLQRAQEKEERRKLEELQRLQRLQEQEEAERLLAEQKRREQEAIKRREVEARAQQQAAAEALRQKNQMLAAQAKYKQGNNKHQGATTYILDSEPDDDESDDESRPKHEIPYWAQAHVRKTQLAMQRHIPEEIVYKFFDTRKCTPDLAELFHGIDRSRLKRTSSAIWKTPPRFSMMETE